MSLTDVLISLAVSVPIGFAIGYVVGRFRPDPPSPRRIERHDFPPDNEGFIAYMNAMLHEDGYKLTEKGEAALKPPPPRDESELQARNKFTEFVNRMSAPSP